VGSNFRDSLWGGKSSIVLVLAETKSAVTIRHTKRYVLVVARSLGPRKRKPFFVVVHAKNQRNVRDAGSYIPKVSAQAEETRFIAQGLVPASAHALGAAFILSGKVPGQVIVLMFAGIRPRSIIEGYVTKPAAH
jgi:hypothetical protein